jgi:hypothetical protein
MKSNSLSLWALWLAVALAVPTAVAQQRAWEMTREQQDIHLAKICSILEKHGDKNLPDGMCEYSPDNWINWLPIVWYTGSWLLALLWAGVLLRSRKEKKEKNSSPEALNAALKEMEIQANKMKNEEPNIEWSVTPDPNEPRKWFIDTVKERIQKIKKPDIFKKKPIPNKETIDDYDIVVIRKYINEGKYPEAEDILLRKLDDILGNSERDNEKNLNMYMMLMEVYFHQQELKKFKGWHMDALKEFPKTFTENTTKQIHSWGLSMDSDYSIESDWTNDKKKPTLVDNISEWVILEWETTVEQLSNNDDTNSNWKNIPVSPEWEKHITPENTRIPEETSSIVETIDLSEEEKMRIFKKLQWTPANSKLKEWESSQKFDMNNMDEAVINQLEQRWFSIIDNKVSWTIDIKTIRKWSSLYWIDKDQIRVHGIDDCYSIDPRTRNATIDILGKEFCIKLILPPWWNKIYSNEWWAY